jgi:D-alanyl-lipoteichoic acid acyltransferase DltB (MBOAT superfamily)
MLFNSAAFIAFFLPLTLAGYYLLGTRAGSRAASLWLFAASLFFYGWWDVRFLPLLGLSLLANYAIGRALARRPRRWLLVLGVGANLGALGWFKYSGFLASVANQLTGAGLPVPQVILPLAISFYTFQQIAYLVDAADGETDEASVDRYCLFVTFFPHLIAGPLVHHREMLAQFNRPETYRPKLGNLALGLTVFGIGLFKKVMLADTMAPAVGEVFGPAGAGVVPSLIDGWLAAIGFALQLYFDFSGYSDMAIGLALMFGLRLPVNFNSPYKSASIIEFWTRWHMTLTRFLMTYLYNPVLRALTARRVRAGKPLLRKGSPALGPFLALLVTPTLVTMTLAGVWHGAGWQFLVFGLMHGMLLVGNHGWRFLRHRLGLGAAIGHPFRPVGVGLTFAAVCLSLVFFRAESLGQAVTMAEGMVPGLHHILSATVVPAAGAGMAATADAAAQLPGMAGPVGAPHGTGLLDRVTARLGDPDVLRLLLGLVIVWALPNTQHWMRGQIVALGVDKNADQAGGLLRWRASAPQGAVVGALMCWTLLQTFSAAPTAFLYFTF